MLVRKCFLLGFAGFIVNWAIPVVVVNREKGNMQPPIFLDWVVSEIGNQCKRWKVDVL